MNNETLYLIKSRDKYGNFILKIGYTKDLESRMATYRTHNPSIELLNTCPGSRELETYYHNYFKEYAYPGYPEWFYYTSEILTKFGTLEFRNCYIVNNLKEKIIKYFYPRSVKDFLKIYQERYDVGNEYNEKYLIKFMVNIRELTIKHLESLDFSNIPDVFFKDTQYFLSISLPFFKEDYIIDLEQILGHQKLGENPWKNSITLIIKTTKEKKKISQEYFDNILKKKIKNSKDMLVTYDEARKELKPRLAINYQIIAKTYQYKDDYVTVNQYFDEKGDEYFKPIFNNLIYISELRAFDIQQKDYKDRFTVASAIKS